MSPVLTLSFSSNRFFFFLIFFPDAEDKIIAGKQLSSAACIPSFFYSVLSVLPQFSCLYAYSIFAKHGRATLQMEKRDKEPASAFTVGEKTPEQAMWSLTSWARQPPPCNDTLMDQYGLVHTGSALLCHVCFVAWESAAQSTLHCSLLWTVNMSWMTSPRSHRKPVAEEGYNVSFLQRSKPTFFILVSRLHKL